MNLLPHFTITTIDAKKFPKTPGSHSSRVVIMRVTLRVLPRSVLGSLFMLMIIFGMLILVGIPIMM